MLRELRGSAGDEAQDILYQGLDRLWRYRKRYIGFDSTVTDVKNLMWKICRNLVRDQHRRKKLKQLPLIWKTKDEDGNAIEKELVYLDGFEDAVCQRMYYRDVMAEVLKHFKNEEDRRCIYLMMRELKPREIAEEITGDAAKADQYRKRCERIKARIKVLLNKMGIWREEF